MDKIQIKILDKRIGNAFAMPSYATDGSAGIDLIACIYEPYNLQPKENLLIPSGIAIYIKNRDYAGFIYPRSGLGHKHGIILGNGTGVIDSDYQGEIKISCWNRSDKNYTINPGDRIAQLVIQKLIQIKWDIVSSFTDESDRGKGGYGHTGT